MVASPITLRKLLFSGKGIEDSWVSFNSGLNIIYGGSNAGKSFTLRAIDFMLGADKLRLPKQGEKYDTVFLWLDLPDGQSITLQRATSGGSFKLYNSHLSPFEALTQSGEVLAPNQKGRKGTSKNDSLSEYFLRQIEIPPAHLVRNETGAKAQFSIRLFSHYVLVGEDEMIGERSPIQIPDQRMSSLDKSLFRFLLTGKDDSSIIEVPNGERLTAARDGKIEILTEMLSTIETEIPSGAIEFDLISQLEKISQTVSSIQEEVYEKQQRLDKIILDRRNLLDKKNANQFKLSELKAMLNRFIELKSVYESDIDRLAALEEGGFLLQRFGDVPCALCGADIIHQHKHNSLDEIELQRRAADAEIFKIKINLTDLKITMTSLEAEMLGCTNQSILFDAEVEDFDREIKELRPQENDKRISYEQAVQIKNDTTNKLNLFKQKSSYENKIQELQSLKIGKQRAEGIAINISTSAAYDFSQTVKSVLKEWHYPDMGEVHFDPKTQDIVVNGRERTDNGKGIRAILHSAFKVAVLIYCREKGLPHPGFIVLDSPLLTYRGPLQFEKHGQLAEDEERFKQTTLNQHFYTHLASLASLGQIIVLENQDPPPEIQKIANVIMFSGEKGSGRQGFFPPLGIDKVG